MRITDEMELLAEQGWCVVLKKLPPGLPWVLESGGGEYDGPESHTEHSRDTWCCEASWMDHDKPWRLSQFACKPTPEDALVAVLAQIKADEERRELRTNQHRAAGT